LDHFHGRYNVVRTHTSDGHCRDDTVGEFKRNHVLLDSDGNPMEEPLDEFVSEIHKMKKKGKRCVQVCSIFLVFTTVLLVVSRVYARSCFHKYKAITIARLKDEDFPVPLQELLDLTAACSLQFTGTGNRTDKNHTVPCRPNVTQIFDTCTPKSKGGEFPKDQPPAKATFNMLHAEYGIDLGIPCVGDVKLCEFYHNGAEWEELGAVLIIVCLMVSCCCRCFILERVKQMTSERTRQIEQQHKSNRNECAQWHADGGFGLLGQGQQRQTPRGPNAGYAVLPQGQPRQPASRAFGARF